MADIITTDGAFTQPDKQLLGLLMDMMIPADDEFPSAADADIFPRTLARLSAQESIVTRGLATLQDLAERTHQQSFASLVADERNRLLDELKTLQPDFVQTLQAHVASSYYQDDRVLRALGLPTRAPHPGGYDVPATDWSLLDPVRKRKPFYIDIPAGNADG